MLMPAGHGGGMSLNFKIHQDIIRMKLSYYDIIKSSNYKIIKS